MLSGVEGPGDGEVGRARWGWTPERRRFVRFAAVGASGVVVNFVFLAVGLWAFGEMGAGAREAAASALGIGVSIGTNFLLNDAWTWGDRKKGGRRRDWARRFATYGVVSGAAAAVQFGVAWVGRGPLGLQVYVAQALGIGVGTVLNYVFSNYLVFKDQS